MQATTRSSELSTPIVRGGAGLALLLVLGLSLALPVGASQDPFQSVMWEHNRDRYLGEDAKVVFDDRVRVNAPPFAEDSSQVPITIDARTLPGKIERIEAWVDLNPLPPIFSYRPLRNVEPLIGLRVRVEQATTIRAAVLTDDGVWHIGGAYVDAAGGGCTAPSGNRGNPDWEKNFGEIRTGSFSRTHSNRLRVLINHPMDTGMVGNIPEFHIQQAVLRDGSGNEMMKMDLGISVSENPLLTFEVDAQTENPVLWLRDNNGNEFQRRF